jgi:hypothetical protein
MLEVPLGNWDWLNQVSFKLGKNCVVGAILALTLAFSIGGCHSWKNSTGPAIEFTKIPPAAQGGRERVDTIAGTVKGAKPGQQIVVYALSGPWWVQPWPEKPYIPVQSDSTWGTETHLGYEYAAMLVDPSYQPPPTMDAAPVAGGAVIAVSIVKGVGTLPPPPTKPLSFSGYDWKIRMTSAARGGVNNLYDADNAWTDSKGALHLRIAKKAGRWTCAQAVLSRSLGYGKYTFVVDDTSRLEPSVVLSMHTYDQWGAAESYRELDMEITHWGDAKSPYNAQYGVQPFYLPGNVAQFTEPGGVLTHSMRWEAGRASFTTVRGSPIQPGAPVVFQHAFTSGVPEPGQEEVEIMLYVVPSDASPLQHDNEAVIEKFEYLP